jgi:hypothetical protein
MHVHAGEHQQYQFILRHTFQGSILLQGVQRMQLQQHGATVLQQQQ